MSETRVDTQVFDSYIGRVQRELPLWVSGVARYEASAVIRVAASMARPASKTKIRNHVRRHWMRSTTDGDYRVSWASRNKNVWLFDRTARIYRLAGRSRNGSTLERGFGWRLNDKETNVTRRIWRKKATQVKYHEEKALRSRGVEHKSWLQAFYAVGGTLGTPPQNARLYPEMIGARPRNGRQYQNGFSRQIRRGRDMVTEVRNTSPLAVRNNGVGKITRAMMRRRAAFRHAMRAGVFSNAQSIARYYPGMMVRA